MTTAVALDALDLAALLCSRVCHDLISPTGAIVNQAGAVPPTAIDANKISIHFLSRIVIAFTCIPD